ncbi:membrane autotransporter barrel domain protein [Azospirillum thermophilum]|uniref:Membrane autotransporter barrel domain protein n=2 Tax=Azospirillum thermophilum TaxID=2202148 RepID=A0A2S2CUI1_9PROT|nr:membrane autotransporter barrel domain protein [Azospirillum thermophilum]
MAQGAAAQVADSVTLGGAAFVNQGLVGVGRIDSAARDRFGETFGSMSGLTFDARSWRRTGDSYSGIMFALPDRGYNAAGTTDYRPRLNTLAITLTPYYGSAAPPAGRGQQSQLSLSLLDTTLLTEASGAVTTGLDPQPRTGVRAASGGFPVLPQAFNGKISLDTEAVVRMPDGSFYISDEYGPYIYRFSASGRMMSAIQPPAALLPVRNGTLDFSSNNPGPNQPAPSPLDPTAGRQNNQGLEGLALTPDRGKLVALLQSATRQDGGTGGSSATRRNTRMLVYDVASNPDNPRLIGHYVVPLPTYQSGGRTQVAAQSEMLALNDKQFLVLSRDSNNGQGLSGTNSLYRSIDIVDISGATNLVGTAYEGATPVAPGGSLVASVTPVAYTSFLNINNNGQLGRFGLHNGGAQDANLLSEKWEAMGILPALDPARPDDVFLFVGNDNDFLTRNGHQVGAAYDAGAKVDTMVLVYRLTLPTYVDPLAIESLRETALPLARGLGNASLSMSEAATRAVRSHLGALQLFAGRDQAMGAASSGPALTGWVAGTLDFNRMNGSGASGAGEGDARTATVGADLRLSETLTVGLAVGAGRNTLSFKEIGGAKQRSWSVSPYVAAAWQGFFGSLSGTWAFDRYDRISRETGAYGLTARGDTNGRSWSVGGEAGYDLGGGDWSFGPVAGARYTRATVDGYTESEAIHLNGVLPDQTRKGWSWDLGAQVAHRFTAESLSIIPQARVSYEWNRVRGAETLSATLANRSFSSLGTVSRGFDRPDRDGLRVGAAVTLASGPVSWQVGYDGKFGQDVRDHNVFTSLGYRF